MAVQLPVPDDGDQSARIELTPIVDMVFLLLVFFMVGAQFANPVIDLELPSADAGGPGPKSEAVISVKAGGAIFLNRAEIQRPEELQARLAELVGEDEAATVVLRADGEAKYAAIVSALAAASEAGVRGLSIEHRAAR